MEFYAFPDFRNSGCEKLNFQYCLDSVLEVYEFHDFRDSGME